MEDEFPIYSLDEGNYARVDDVFENGEAITVGAEESEQATPDGQASEAVYMNDAEEEQYENELPSSSQAIYDMNEIDELFTNDESPVSLPADEAAQLPAEVEFTLRTMRNRVTALELQVNQLTQQVNYEKKEREADNVHWEGLLNTAEATLEKERTSMRNELTELKAKHIEELQAKHALHGKVENIEKVRRDYDNLVVENTKLEAKYAKAAADSQSQKTELAHARSEVNKLKADFTKMKTEFDACRAEIAEKGSENNRLKKEGELGRGSQEEQLKRLTADKTRLEEQVKNMRLEANTMTQMNTRVTAELASAERSSTQLKAEILQLQQASARAESVDRELHQAKWRITQLESEVRDTSGDLNFRLTQSQTQLNQLQSQLMHAQQQLAQTQAQLSTSQQQLAQAQQQIRTMSAMQSAAPVYVPPPPMPAPMYVPAPYLPPPQPAQVPAQQPSRARSSSAGRSLHSASSRSSLSQQPAVYDPNSYQSSYQTSYAPAPAMNLTSLASSNAYAPSAARSASSYGGSSSGAGGPAAPLHNRRVSGGAGPIDSAANAPFGTSSKSPFANEVTSAQINHVFDDLDRKLTAMMTEKTTLQEESERLHQRGLKTLKDRTRLQSVEHRLGELTQDITHIRKELSFKPG